jgi:DNA-binding PadR family transcriptional regulator
LFNHGCQTSHQLTAYIARVYGDSYSSGTISASLRKLILEEIGAYSENEKGQKVYWLTESGICTVAEAIAKGEIE